MHDYLNYSEILKDLIKGNKFCLDMQSELGNNERVNFPHSELYEYLTPNSILLIDDGKIKLQIIEQKKDCLVAEVLNGGKISNNKV